MNNLLSYCGLVDAKIRASDKDLPVKTIFPSMIKKLTNKKTNALFSTYIYRLIWIGSCYALYKVSWLANETVIKLSFALNENTRAHIDENKSMVYVI